MNYFALFITLILFMAPARGVSDTGNELASSKIDRPTMLELEESSEIQSLVSSGNYEIRQSRRRVWDPDSESETRVQPLFPFPVVRNYNRKNVMRARKWIPDRRKDTKGTPATSDWENTGLQGVGVTLSVDVARRGRDYYDKILLGTQASGLYLRDGGLNGTWTKLPYPRKSAIRVAINSDNTRHFVVAHQYQLTRDPSTIFQSCDNGNSWQESELLSVTDPGTGSTYQLILRDLVLRGNRAVILAEDTERTQVVVATATMRCESVVDKRSRKKVRRGKVEDFTLRFITPRLQQPGRLKAEQNTVLFSVRIGARDALMRSSNGGVDWQEIASADPLYLYSSYASANNGQRIVATFIEQSKDTAPFLMKRSDDSGQTWQDATPTTLTVKYPGSADRVRSAPFRWDVQDVLLSQADESYVGLFIFMRGLVESTDRGQTFVQDIQGLQDVAYFPQARVGADMVAIVPDDLRGGAMKVERSSNFRHIFLPTDQGFHVYDRTTKVVRNLAPDLYLVESRGIAISSCPRIYSGLWHVGAYWISSNGSIGGFNGSESDGFGLNPDPDLNCGTIPAYSLAHGYAPNGVNLDVPVSTELAQSINDVTEWPFGRYPHFDGNQWWYLYARTGRLYRININTGSFTLIDQVFGEPISFKAIGSAHSRRPDALYVVDGDNRLLQNTFAIGWSYINDFDLTPAVADQLEDMGDEIIVNRQKLLWYGTDGAIYSKDGGLTFTGLFAGRRISAATIDNCGWIYLAVSPGEGVRSGVYVSKNDGVRFSKLGRADSQSYIRDLEMYEDRRILYASTYGESLLRYEMPAGCR